MSTPLDLQTFNQLFNDYQNQFSRFANTYVRDFAIAEDFTMEALTYYWENRHTLSPDSNIPAYILAIIKNKCLNHLRHVRVRQTTSEKMKRHYEWEMNTRIASLEACEPYEIFAVEIKEIVDTTLAGLSAQTRDVFIMSRFQNLSHKEIAELLAISTKGVEYHITNTLVKLREALKDYKFLFPFLLFLN